MSQSSGFMLISVSVISTRRWRRVTYMSERSYSMGAAGSAGAGAGADSEAEDGGGSSVFAPSRSPLVWMMSAILLPRVDLPVPLVDIPASRDDAEEIIVRQPSVDRVAHAA